MKCAVDVCVFFFLFHSPGETLEDKYNRPELFPEEVAQMEAEREQKGLHRKKERREGGDKDEVVEHKLKGTQCCSKKLLSVRSNRTRQSI